MKRIVIYTLLIMVILSCQSTNKTKGEDNKNAEIVIARESVDPGSSITKFQEPVTLIGSPIAIGSQLPSLQIKDAASNEVIDLDSLKGNVLLLSVVPSINTPVCEVQTHYLGEEGASLPSEIQRITISTDTVEDFNKFSGETGLTDIIYLSDKELNQFGSNTGLNLDGVPILARSVIIVDKEGVIQYIQVVPEITHLPDLEKAFEVAKSLL